MAGLLVGASLVLRRVEHAGVRRAAADLSASLVRRVQRKLRAGDPSGLLHGWGGVLYALLAWSRVTGRDVPAVAVDALRAHVRAWRPAAIAPAMRASWCAGAAGAALLWSHAYERTGERAFLLAARRAARTAHAALHPDRRHLCCGAGGVAYALLAVHRVDRDGGWRARAREAGALAVRSTTPLRRPNGLLWGHPGLVCLALDLVAGEAAGFPAIEA
jgi:serine/threonine-protein kinase